MSQEELDDYFKGAQSEGRIGGGASAKYQFDVLGFRTTEGRSFNVHYVDRGDLVVVRSGLKTSNKPHVVSITSDDYPLVSALFQ